MTNGILELQRAVYAALTGDATLSGMITGVFNHVPQGTQFPYVKFGHITAERWDSLSAAGYKVTLPIDVYSRYRGNKEVLEIVEEIKRLLHDVRLSMENNWQMVGMLFVSLDTISLTDGLSYEGSITFRSWISEVV